MTTTKQRMSLLAILAIVTTGTAIAGISDVFATDPPIPEDTSTVYNPDMTNWWDDLIEHLGNESSVVWYEPGQSNEIWTEIESLGENTYQISLYGIAASGDPIVYTITETTSGYSTYGPVMEDGTMNARSYVKSSEGVDDNLRDQPIKPQWTILQDSTTGQNYINDQHKYCHWADESWFGGDVTDDWDGSRINYRANGDAYDNCMKPLYVDDVDLDWRNGWYNLHITGTSDSGSPYFYTPDPDGTTTFQMRINWA